LRISLLTKLASFLLATLLASCSGPQFFYTMSLVEQDSVTGVRSIQLSTETITGEVDHGVATFTGGSINLTAEGRARTFQLYAAQNPKLIVLILPPFGMTPPILQPVVWELLRKNASCIVADFDYDPKIDASITTYVEHTLGMSAHVLTDRASYLPANHHNLPVSLYGISYGGLVASRLATDSTTYPMIQCIVIEAPILDVEASWRDMAKRLSIDPNAVSKELLAFKPQSMFDNVSPQRVYILASRNETYNKNINLDESFAMVPPGNRRFLDMEYHHYRIGIQNNPTLWTDINTWVASALVTKSSSK